MLLTEKFINRLNENGIVNEILKEVVMLKSIEDATSEHTLIWAHREEAQRAQKSTRNEIKVEKDL